ncbi:DDHD domain-containing protein [Pilobolus umbonatus]|nr:DDHD domain-containing protein [Pilobolus umbonatus]
MTETKSHQRTLSIPRRNPRPLNLIPDLDVPPLTPRWFHAIDNPIIDPISIRKAKSSSFINKSNPPPKSPSTPKLKMSSKWVPFSQRDSAALEKAYQNDDVRAKVAVNEDHLFEVDVSQRTISPVYWEGPTYEVRRATWFMQTDGWIPCEENLSEQIELGYYKHRPFEASMTVSSSMTTEEDTLQAPSSTQKLSTSPKEDTVLSEEKKEAIPKQSTDKHWNLLGPYLGQYIVYANKTNAWLLSNTTSSKFAKSIITRLTNKHNLGGIRLVRGYPEVEELTKKSKNTPKVVDEDKKEENQEEDVQTEEEKHTMEQIEAHDYENEESEGEVRKIDHLMFVIHGVGQKMSERTGQTFIHDVNMLRKTIKLAFPSVSTTISRSNGIQVLPIMWRQDIKFGMAADDEEGIEADMGTIGVEDGCPTLDELTLEGVPNIRTVVSDVLMDVPLYMTPRYREQMTHIISKEINRVYKLFGSRNPDFLEKGKLSIFGHSLGSLLAFDMLTLQPPTPPRKSRLPIPTLDKKIPPLLFPVENFFAAGSPLGVILLLRGFKIASRKSLTKPDQSVLSDVKSPSPSSINLCYPAVENLYNIFHKSDPVAYRIEPLIARHYTAKMKPEPIPYMKGGLKGVIDASLHVGSGIANRAGAMYESFKTGLTTNLLMRGLGLTRQQIYQDSHPTIHVETEEEVQAEEQDEVNDVLLKADDINNRTNRMRSMSDPAHAFSSDFRYKKTTNRKKSTTRKSPPLPLPTANGNPYSQGAKKINMLNVTGRVDYCIQEGLLENPYLSAFSAHMQYWQDFDVAAFLIRQIYR